MTAAAVGVLAGVAVLAASFGALIPGCPSPTTQSWERAPLPAGGIEVTTLTTGPQFSIERVRFHSAEVDEPRFFIAIVPGGGAARDVLILNHGWSDRPEDLVRHLKVDAVYGEMLAAKQVKPAIIVMPDIRFSNFYRRNAQMFPFNQSLVLVAEETSAIVSKRYDIPRERERWNIGGFSFGGYVALDVVRRYGGWFGRATIVSGFYDEDWTFWPAVEPPPGRLDGRGRGKHSIVVAGPKPQLLLACGTEDRFFRRMTRLHELFTAQGIDHDWTTSRGGHTWKYWSTTLRPLLRFHLRVGAPQEARATTTAVAVDRRR